MGSSAAHSVATLWTTTETEGTPAILQQCGSGASTAPQNSSGVAVAELSLFDVGDGASTMGRGI